MSLDRFRTQLKDLIVEMPSLRQTRGMNKGKLSARHYTNHGVPTVKPVSARSRAGRVQRYLRECADCLGLKDWEIVFDQTELDAGDEDVQAGVCHSEAQHAEIQFAKEFWTFPPEYQRHVVAHELSHLLVARMREFVDGLSNVLPEGEYRMADAAFEAAEEHDVESIARLLAPLLPIPKF